MKTLSDIDQSLRPNYESIDNLLPAVELDTRRYPDEQPRRVTLGTEDVEEDMKELEDRMLLFENVCLCSGHRDDTNQRTGYGFEKSVYGPKSPAN